eukprot:5126912-Pleurochrysis_carterae.AAC.1
MTRPDTSYHTFMLCRFMHNPSINCCSRAEVLLNYLYSHERHDPRARRQDHLRAALRHAPRRWR